MRGGATREKALFDTNLYIDWLNAGRHEAALFQRDAVKYLSAVVMLELYAGAFSPRDRRIVHSLVTVFRLGRSDLGSFRHDLQGCRAYAPSPSGITRVPPAEFALLGE